MSGARALLIAVGMAAALGGCWSGECTLKGCPYVFSVDFVKATQWAAGAYRVEVEADGVSETCEVVMPFTCPSSSTCPGGRHWQLVESACGAAAQAQAIAGVTFPRQRPAQLTVQVVYEGKIIGAQTFRPSYVESQPNGPRCETTCWSAPTAVLSLP